MQDVVALGVSQFEDVDVGLSGEVVLYFVDVSGGEKTVDDFAALCDLHIDDK